MSEHGRQPVISEHVAHTIRASAHGLLGRHLTAEEEEALIFGNKMPDELAEALRRAYRF